MRGEGGGLPRERRPCPSNSFPPHPRTLLHLTVGAGGWCGAGAGGVAVGGRRDALTVQEGLTRPGPARAHAPSDPAARPPARRGCGAAGRRLARGH
jgi:hypothetical protein